MKWNPRYSHIVVLPMLPLLVMSAAAAGQGPPKTLKLDGPTATGALRCAPDESIQFALIGLDENLNSTSLGLYAPQARSTSESIVVARVGDEAATRVNVLCVADGEAWITVEAAGVRADVPVLVGTARRKASPKGPHPELAQIASGRGPVAQGEQVAQAPAQGQPVQSPITARSEAPAQLPITVRPDAPAQLPITVRPDAPAQLPNTAPSEAPPRTQSMIPPQSSTQPAPTSSAGSEPVATLAAPTSGAAVNRGAQRTQQVQNSPPPDAGTVSSSSAGSGALPAPTNVTARYLGEGRIAVRWAAVPGAAVYDILAHKPGEASWYPLTTRPIAAKGLVTNPATGINVPAGAVELVVVPRRDAQDNTGARSTPVQLNVPRYSGRYRVTVNGFRVNRETVDAQMNFDGKNDEIYVRVGVKEFDPDGKPVGPERVARTKTHGDQNADRWRQQGAATFRYVAGNASALGGLKTGNGYPNQAAPWGPATTTSNETFPLFVWEGYLREGGNTVAIVPVIYEDDENAFELVPETRALLDVGAWMGGRGYQAIETAIEGEEAYRRKSIVPERQIRAQALVAQAGAVNLSSHFQATGSVVGQTGQLVGGAGLNAVPVGPLVRQAMANWMQNQLNLKQSSISLLRNYTAAASLLLNNKDRPIGMAGIQNGEIIFDPEMIALSFEKAEEFLATKNPNSDIPAGITEVRYVDTVPGGNGDYTLYIEIKRLQ